MESTTNAQKIIYVKYVVHSALSKQVQGYLHLEMFFVQILQMTPYITIKYPGWKINKDNRGHSYQIPPLKAAEWWCLSPKQSLWSFKVTIPLVDIIHLDNDLMG